MTQRSEFTWRGDEIGKGARKAAARGLIIWAEHVLQQARAIVPLDEGTLERSGVASINEPTLTAAVSFDTPYAVPQHEDLSLNHTDGRQAKYLERPFVASKKLAGPIIAREVRKVTGK